jgi:hypothetical protein
MGPILGRTDIKPGTEQRAALNRLCTYTNGDDGLTELKQRKCDFSKLFSLFYSITLYSQTSVHERLGS